MWLTGRELLGLGFDGMICVGMAVAKEEPGTGTFTGETEEKGKNGDGSEEN